MELNNQVAIVTGGGSGLGLATAKKLVAQGARVVVADRNTEAGQAAAIELGDAATFAEMDVTQADAVQAAIDTATQLGALRAVVNCAGIGSAGRTIAKDGTPFDLDMFRMTVEINLVGTFNVIRLAASAMAQNEPLAHNERGVIVNTASVAAYEGQIGQVAYAASKAGVVGMTLPIARDLSVTGIRVLTIAPGTFDTPMLGMLPAEIKEAIASSIPFPKELGSPEHYAMLAEHMIKNPYINGETVRLDGALRLAPR